MFFTHSLWTHMPQTFHPYVFHLRTDSYPHMFCFFTPTDLSPICVSSTSLVPMYVFHTQPFHPNMLFTSMFDVSPVCLSPTDLSPIPHSLFTHTCCSLICSSPTDFLARCFSSTDFSHPSHPSHPQPFHPYMLFTHMFVTH